MEAKGKKTGKRVPDHLRRRTLVSCDRCKKRRIKCIKPPETEAQDSCLGCLEAGADCESTLPRKTRIYGSVQSLSVRYRTMEALLKALYPQHDTTDISTLHAIAKSHNITLPAFTDNDVTEDIFSSPNNSVPSPDAASIAHHARSMSGDTETEPSTPAKVVEEKLVPLPQGPSHYIGPSSSFGFVLTVRNMVAEFNQALKATQPEDERSKLSSEFAGSNWSKALEPIDKEESDDSSEEPMDSLSPHHVLSNVGQNNAFVKPVPFSPISPVPSSIKPSRKTTLLSIMLNREVCDIFINAYFDRVHPNYLLFHRGSFQIKYKAMWDDPMALLRNSDPGWVCCVCMMLVFGAQVLENQDKTQSSQIQRHYLSLVQIRMHDLISATTLINIQAILLLQLYQHNCTERNSAFMLLGCASRMAMALGMHRGGSSGGFDDMEREVRKRVWWTAYNFEQNQCAILGRPCAIDDSEVTVGFPSELILDSEMSVPSAYVEYTVRLTKLMSGVRRRIYTASTNLKHGDAARSGLARQFLLDIESWRLSLPAQLRLDSPSHTPRHRRAILLLHIFFYHTKALATRPFLLRKVSVQVARKLGKHVRSQDLDKEELELSHACGVYSREGAVLLHELMVNGLFEGVLWMDGYYVYHAVFILALDFLARPWDETETTEDLDRKATVRSVMESLQNMKLCPTFTVLTQVSLQLAKIVGIFEVHPPAGTQVNIEPKNINQYPAQQRALHPYEINNQAPQPGVELAVNSWFQKEPSSLPWDPRDFFGADSYVGPTAQDFTDAPMAMAGLFNSFPGMDDFAPPLPENIAFTQWGVVDTQFAPRGGVPTNSVYHGGS